MQRVKIEPDKAIEVYFYVPKCINYQTIFLDIAFNAEEEEKQFEDKLETCAEQLHDGSKYTYKCLENPVQWAIFDAQGKEVIKGKMEKIPARKGKDIYTPSLGKEFYTLPVGRAFIPPSQGKIAAETLPKGNYLFKVQLINQENKSLEKYIKITDNPSGETMASCSW